MRCKCIHCAKRTLLEKRYDGDLLCSHVTCTSCGAKLIIWYGDEDKIVLIEDEGEEQNGS